LRALWTPDTNPQTADSWQSDGRHTFDAGHAGSIVSRDHDASSSRPTAAHRQCAGLLPTYARIASMSTPDGGSDRIGTRKNIRPNFASRLQFLRTTTLAVYGLFPSIRIIVAFHGQNRPPASDSLTVDVGRASITQFNCSFDERDVFEVPAPSDVDLRARHNATARDAQDRRSERRGRRRPVRRSSATREMFRSRQRASRVWRTKEPLVSCFRTRSPVASREPHPPQTLSHICWTAALLSHSVQRRGVSAKVAARLRGDLIPKTVHCNLPTGRFWRTC
jgi:hypothetical protein